MWKAGFQEFSRSFIGRPTLYSRGLVRSLPSSLSSRAFLVPTFVSMFFCLPILIGCQQKLKPEGDLAPRICPHCNNASVFSAKSTTWFEFFFIPLVPFSSKHIWLCQICHWMAPHVAGQWEPMIAYGGFPIQPTYQPGYVNRAQPTPPNPYQPVYLESSMHQP